MKQSTLLEDWPRAKQLDLLRDVKLPAQRGIASHTLKAVLRTIDEFARGRGSCFASHDRLADAANCSKATVRRALDALVALSLITRESQPKHGGGFRNFYSIVWNDLKLLHESEPPAHREQVACAHDEQVHVLTVEQPRAHGATGTCSPCKNHVLTHEQVIVIQETQQEAQEETRAPRKPRPRPEDVPLPPILDTPEFRAVRDEWIAQRRAKRASCRPEFLARQYPRLEPLGVARAIECLRHTIDNDYVGIFPEKFTPNARSPAGKYRAPESAMTYDPTARERNPNYGKL